MARIPFGWGPGLYAASVNKYYVDELYRRSSPAAACCWASALWWFDAKVIDGAVNGAGWLSQRIGSILRRHPDRADAELRPRASPAGWSLVLIAYLVMRP